MTHNIYQYSPVCSESAVKSSSQVTDADRPGTGLGNLSAMSTVIALDPGTDSGS